MGTLLEIFVWKGWKCLQKSKCHLDKLEALVLIGTRDFINIAMEQ